MEGDRLKGEDLSSGNSIPTDPVLGENKESTPPPPREHLISTAVKFLQSSSVVSSTFKDKQDFLKKKGLTDQEISEALIRAQNYVEARHHALDPNHQENRVRNWSVIAIVFGGVLYGCYRFYREYLIPFLTEERSATDSLTSKLAQNTEALSTFSNRIDQLQQSTERNSQKIDQLQTSCRTSGNSSEIKELKDELSSLKRLLLSRHQFPETPEVKPVIPSWQLEESSIAEPVAPTAGASNSQPLHTAGEAVSFGSSTSVEKDQTSLDSHSDQGGMSDPDSRSMTEQTAVNSTVHKDDVVLEQSTTGGRDVHSSVAASRFHTYSYLPPTQQCSNLFRSVASKNHSKRKFPNNDSKLVHPQAMFVEHCRPERTQVVPKPDCPRNDQLMDEQAALPSRALHSPFQNCISLASRRYPSESSSYTSAASQLTPSEYFSAESVLPPPWASSQSVVKDFLLQTNVPSSQQDFAVTEMPFTPDDVDERGLRNANYDFLGPSSTTTHMDISGNKKNLSTVLGDREAEADRGTARAATSADCMTASSLSPSNTLEQLHLSQASLREKCVGTDCLQDCVLVPHLSLNDRLNKGLAYNSEQSWSAGTQTKKMPSEIGENQHLVTYKVLGSTDVYSCTQRCRPLPTPRNLHASENVHCSQPLEICLSNRVVLLRDCGQDPCQVNYIDECCQATISPSADFLSSNAGPVVTRATSISDLECTPLDKPLPDIENAVNDYHEESPLASMERLSTQFEDFITLHLTTKLSKVNSLTATINKHERPFAYPQIQSPIFFCFNPKSKSTSKVATARALSLEAVSSKEQDLMNSNKFMQSFCTLLNMQKSCPCHKTSCCSPMASHEDVPVRCQALSKIIPQMVDPSESNHSACVHTKSPKWNPACKKMKKLVDEASETCERNADKATHSKIKVSQTEFSDKISHISRPSNCIAQQTSCVLVTNREIQTIQDELLPVKILASCVGMQTDRSGECVPTVTCSAASQTACIRYKDFAIQTMSTEHNTLFVLPDPAAIVKVDRACGTENISDGYADDLEVVVDSNSQSNNFMNSKFLVKPSSFRGSSRKSSIAKNDGTETVSEQNLAILSSASSEYVVASSKIIKRRSISNGLTTLVGYSNEMVTASKATSTSGIGVCKSCKQVYEGVKSAPETSIVGCQTAVHIPWCQQTSSKGVLAAPFFTNIHGISKYAQTTHPTFFNICLGTFTQTANASTLTIKPQVCDIATDVCGITLVETNCLQHNDSFSEVTLNSDSKAPIQPDRFSNLTSADCSDKPNSVPPVIDLNADAKLLLEEELNNDCELENLTEMSSKKTCGVKSTVTTFVRPHEETIAFSSSKHFPEDLVLLPQQHSSKVMSITEKLLSITDQQFKAQPLSRTEQPVKEKSLCAIEGLVREKPLCAIEGLVREKPLIIIEKSAKDKQYLADIDMHSSVRKLKCEGSDLLAREWPEKSDSLASGRKNESCSKLSARDSTELNGGTIMFEQLEDDEILHLTDNHLGKDTSALPKETLDKDTSLPSNYTLGEEENTSLTMKLRAKSSLLPFKRLEKNASVQTMPIANENKSTSVTRLKAMIPSSQKINFQSDFLAALGNESFRPENLPYLPCQKQSFFDCSSQLSQFETNAYPIMDNSRLSKLFGKLGKTSSCSNLKYSISDSAIWNSYFNLYSCAAACKLSSNKAQHSARDQLSSHIYHSALELFHIDKSTQVEEMHRLQDDELSEVSEQDDEMDIDAAWEILEIAAKLSENGDEVLMNSNGKLGTIPEEAEEQSLQRVAFSTAEKNLSDNYVPTGSKSGHAIKPSGVVLASHSDGHMDASKMPSPPGSIALAPAKKKTDLRYISSELSDFPTLKEGDFKLQKLNSTSHKSHSQGDQTTLQCVETADTKCGLLPKCCTNWSSLPAVQCDETLTLSSISSANEKIVVNGTLSNLTKFLDSNSSTLTCSTTDPLDVAMTESVTDIFGSDSESVTFT